MDSQDVSQMRQIAYVFSQCVCAIAEIEGMKVANHERRNKGYADAFSEESFFSVMDKYGLHHNAVLTALTP